MRLVVDTNVIIAGLLKDSITRKILFHPFFAFYIPEQAFSEIERHEDELIKKSGLTRHKFHVVLDSMRRKIAVVPAHEFAGHYPKALQLMRDIDECDAPFVALALSLQNEGVWINDAHLGKQRAVRVWTTKELLAELMEIDEDLYFNESHGHPLD